jgi:hypothetical protein
MTASSSSSQYLSAFGLPQFDAIPWLKKFAAGKVPTTNYSGAFETLPNANAGNTGSLVPVPNASTNPVPDTAQDEDAYWRRRAMDYSFDTAMYQDMLDKTNQQNMLQMQQSYPWLSAAAWDATNRNLYASKDIMAYKQKLPTTLEEIAASRQARAASASDAFARQAAAIAAQNQSATGLGSSTIPRYG